MSTVAVTNVVLRPLEQPANGELAESVVRTCSFCLKQEPGLKPLERLSSRLTGGQDYYCSFCLRNGFHTRNANQVLVMSFRSIVGYYYHELYLRSNRRLWLSEIEDYLRVHESVGLMNPVFSYDPTTLLWFVDFGKVGTSKKKLKVEEVLKTVVNILATFNLTVCIPNFHTSKFYQKYKDAIMGFHSQRYRPEGRRMLIPTLMGCMHHDSRQNGVAEKTRNFTLADLVAE